MTDNSTPTPPPGLAFPEVMTIHAAQRHMEAMCAHFGWDAARDEQTFLLLVEEVGELAKAIRKVTGLLDEQHNPAKPVISAAARQHNLAEEFGDVLSYLFELASRFNVDLEAAYRAKMLDTMQRTWA